MTEKLALATPAELTETLLATPALLGDLVAPLSAAEAAALVDHLKNEADRHWWINANQSLVFADLIVRIGRLRGDAWQTALGTMARGDALKFVGNIQEAWNLLGEAGALFESIGDAVGWARTRIGRMLISVELSRVDEALADAERAREIFEQSGELARLLGLLNNTAILHSNMGHYSRALDLYNDAMKIALSLGEHGQSSIPLLHIGIGYAYDMLGNFRNAASAYEQAHQIFMQRGERRGIALVEHNLASLDLNQGQYRRALKLLHSARDLYNDAQLTLDANHVSRDLVDAYMQLNRFAEARDLAHRVAATYQELHSTYQEGHALLFLAMAEAQLGQTDEANATLDQAAAIFTSLGAELWQAMTLLRRGQVALKIGHFSQARKAASTASSVFLENNKQIQYAEAILVDGQASLREGDVARAITCARTALHISQACNAPTIRYRSHALLGLTAEAQSRDQHALRHYAAAMAMMERVQRGLTITLRPGFLEDKIEAFQQIVQLQLKKGCAEAAFNSLERAKSQTFLSYLTNHDQLRWTSEDPRSKEWIATLGKLREEHQWHTQQAHALSVHREEQKTILSPDQAIAEIARCEREMRAVTERLYLVSDHGWSKNIVVPDLHDIQTSLPQDALLIEWYTNGTDIWAFTVDTNSINSAHLPNILPEVYQILARLQANIEFALKSTNSNAATSLAMVACRILQQLYKLLLEPLSRRLSEYTHIYIAPYSVLHYLPFHLLHNGTQYLIETHDISILPAAGLLTRKPARQAPGATIVAHSGSQYLAHIRNEATIIQSLIGGAIYAEQNARRSVFALKPNQILHIAAHSQHRLDQPELSYIELADGHLLADDLFQHALQYELVVLSACETGRASVATNEELIGIGRGFLYAGAASLVTSLWRVADATTVQLMETFYSALQQGFSKAAALRHAQCSILAEQPRQHPAFWGAFQLIGDAGPLSQPNIV